MRRAPRRPPVPCGPMNSRTRPPSAMPPGPPLPKAVQTPLQWLARPWWMATVRRRYGDIVTFSTSFDSGFVMVFDPDWSSRSSAPRPTPARGRGQRAAGPDPRPALGAAARRGRAPAPAQAAAAAVPRRAHARLRRGDARGRRPRDRRVAGRASRSRLRPRMQALTLEVIMRAVFGVAEGERLTELKRRLRAMIVPHLAPARGAVLAFARPPPARALRRVPARTARRRRAHLRARSPAAARPPTSTSARTSSRCCSRPATRTAAADRRRAARRARHAARRRPRDDRHRPGLGLRPPRPPPARARPAALVAGRGETDYLDAVVKETLRVRPVIPGIGRAVRGGRSRSAAGSCPRAWRSPVDRLIHRRDDRYPQPASSAPSASSVRTRPTPTRGSRSVAAPAAAWAPRSRPSRWPPSSGPSCSRSTCAPQTRHPSAPRCTTSR